MISFYIYITYTEGIKKMKHYFNRRSVLMGHAPKLSSQGRIQISTSTTNPTRYEEPRS